MTTNGTGITRDEAEAILQLMKFSEAEPSNGSMAVLKKIYVAYPDLLRGTNYVSQIADYDRKVQTNKQAALKVIAKSIEGAYKLIREAEAAADNAGVSFTFDMHGTYGMGGTYEGGNWTSSSDQC
jgi:hypothetical protein